MWSPISLVIVRDDRRQLRAAPGRPRPGGRAAAGRATARGCSRAHDLVDDLGQLGLEDGDDVLGDLVGLELLVELRAACRAWRSPCRRRSSPSWPRGRARCPASRCRPAGCRGPPGSCAAARVASSRRPGTWTPWNRTGREQHDQARPVDQPADDRGEDGDRREREPVEVGEPPWPPPSVRLTTTRPVTHPVHARLPRGVTRCRRWGRCCPDARRAGARRRLRALLRRCAACCCRSGASSGFGEDKAGRGGLPPPRPPTTTAGSTTALRERGWSGCAVFDCFGAGQHVSQVTYGGTSWREQDHLGEMAAVLSVMRQLHEMLAHLARGAAPYAGARGARRAWDRWSSCSHLADPDDAARPLDLDEVRSPGQPRARGGHRPGARATARTDAGGGPRGRRPARPRLWRGRRPARRAAARRRPARRRPRRGPTCWAPTSATPTSAGRGWPTRGSSPSHSSTALAATPRTDPARVTARCGPLDPGYVPGPVGPPIAPGPGGP